MTLPNYRSSDVGFISRFSVGPYSSFSVMKNEYIVSASPAMLFVRTGLEIRKLLLYPIIARAMLGLFLVFP
jgi:hypothetical protein